MSEDRDSSWGGAADGASGTAAPLTTEEAGSSDLSPDQLLDRLEQLLDALGLNWPHLS